MSAALVGCTAWSQSRNGNFGRTAIADRFRAPRDLRGEGITRRAGYSTSTARRARAETRLARRVGGSAPRDTGSRCVVPGDCVRDGSAQRIRRPHDVTSVRRPGQGVQARFLDRAHESLRVGVEVRRARGQANGLHASRRQCLTIRLRRTTDPDRAARSASRPRTRAPRSGGDRSG